TSSVESWNHGKSGSMAIAMMVILPARYGNYTSAPQKQRIIRYRARTRLELHWRQFLESIFRLVGQEQPKPSPEAAMA
ncbi:hypothetical protein ACFL6C_14520, partial [Myxococcota bacterium]